MSPMLRMCVCVCVCVWERERERERWGGGEYWINQWFFLTINGGHQQSFQFNPSLFTPSYYECRPLSPKVLSYTFTYNALSNPHCVLCNMWAILHILCAIWIPAEMWWKLRDPDKISVCTNVYPACLLLMFLPFKHTTQCAVSFLWLSFWPLHLLQYAAVI